MNLRTFSLLIVLSPTLLFADGLPLNEDRTKYEGSHYLVTLNEDQLEEVTVIGTLTLTSDQWKEAREKNSNTPKRIDAILPSTHNDCMCGMEEETFGVWFKNGTVAVVFGNTPVPFDQLPTEAKDELAKNLHFYIDERGQFYQDGKLIPYSDVKARAAYLKAAPAEASSVNLEGLNIDLPPHLKATDPALAGRLTELQKIAKTAGRSFYVMWDMTGLEE